MPEGDEKRNWKKFQTASFNGKRISSRVKKVETATTRHARKFIFRRLNSIREVRQHIITWLLIVAILIAAAGFQIVWFQRSYQTVAAAPGGTYAEASLGPVDTLNPLYASSDAEMAASRLIFSSLYNFDTTGHLGGDIAKTMKTSEDGKTYTVELRPNVKWHDGAALTADDVVFTLNLIKNPETRSSLRVNWQDILVKKLDQQTIQFTLPDSYAAFSSALTFPILPMHILEKVTPSGLRENSFSRSPIGSGPFKLQLLQTSNVVEQNKIVHMNANSAYYGGAPKLDRFEIHSYSSEKEMIQALRTTEVTAAAGVSAGAANDLHDKTFTVQSTPIDNGVYALFNNQKPALKDLKVRQALRLAVDTAALRKKIAGEPLALDIPFIPSVVKSASDIKAPAADREQAAKLLDESGWNITDGIRQKDGIPLMISITTIKDSQYSDAAQILSNDWKAIGVKTNVVVVDPTSRTTNFVQNILQPRNYDVLLYEFILGADADVYAYWHTSQIGMTGYNFANYSSPLADATLSTARSQRDASIRDAKYRAFATSWLNDAPAIGLYQSTATYAYRNGVNALPKDVTLVSSTDRFANVQYWTVGEKSVYKTP